VDVGQTVAASLQAPTLFVIAADLTAMQVNASIDEADVGKIVEDAVVEFTVDAYPNDVFRGTIQEIRLDPQSVQNVVTYNAIVGVDNPELKLKPGMTANVAVTIQRSDDVLAVPNAALRYAPTSLPEPDVSRPTGGNSEGRGSATPERERTRPSAGTERGTVWVLDVSDELQANRVVLGITDGVWTELLMSDLEEGEEVIVGELAGTATASNARTGGAPFSLGAAPQGRGLR
jgi:HlyD family secretion protein